VASGSAFDVYERWIRAQGGDPSLDALEDAPVVAHASAPRAGTVTRLGALNIGIAALELGAGRRTKDDDIDHAVGIVCHAKRGVVVEQGDILAEVHARSDEDAGAAVEAVLASYDIGDPAPQQGGILLEVVT